MDEILAELRTLDLSGLYERDFLDLTQKTGQELAGICAVADALRDLRERNYSVAIFQNGLALHSPGGCFLAFAAACEMLGLRAVEVSEPRLNWAIPDVLAVQGPFEDTLFRRKILHQRPLRLKADTGLPMILYLIHRFNGVEGLRGQELPLLSQPPEDMARLADRLGMVPGATPLEELEVERMEAYRPYILAAMIFLGKAPEPARLLEDIQRRATPRRLI